MENQIQTSTDNDDAYVVFKTNTLLDIRGITTFGLNAKPNTKSPIGYFGTGLKMAIAVLMRHGIGVRLFIGPTEYEFYTKEADFRGVDYLQIMMRKRNGLLKNWSAVALPFTTELAKNWALWQAFRELESNTRDEGGISSVHSSTGNSQFVNGPDTTTIIVGPSEKFTKVYEERDKYFLPEALKVWDYQTPNIQIFKKPSDAIYYRGIRIFELQKPSIFTYNILRHVELTEDRTAKYEWDLKSAVQAFLANQEDRGLINQLLNATEDHWEASLDWDSAWSSAPSPVFKDLLTRRVAKAKGKEGALVPRFMGYHSTFTPTIKETVSLKDRFHNWANECNIYNVLTQEQSDQFDELCRELT